MGVSGNEEYTQNRNFVVERDDKSRILGGISMVYPCISYFQTNATTFFVCSTATHLLQTDTVDLLDNQHQPAPTEIKLVLI